MPRRRAVRRREPRPIRRRRPRRPGRADARRVGRREWPDALFLAGDQIYADEPSDELRARLRAAHRAGPDDDRHEADDVREEIGDFEQYTWLYHESWTPEPIRWLFSTVPTLMLLDDHDLRDDWNTSQAWRDRVTRERWWHDRVTGAFASYWVYQHLGNLSPDDLPDDPMWPVVTSGIGDDERTQRLDEFARRSDAQPDSARWSFHRDFGPRVRLVAVDARCSRVLDPADRHIVDPVETRWLVERATERPVTHLLLGSTLPFLLTPGVHHLEGWDEAVAGGAWGRRAVGTAERIRQGLDLEHWAAFRRSFDAVVELLARIGSGECPPRTITLLGGDVHCSYTALAEVAGVDPTRTAIRQLTMSPFRNPLQRSVRAVQRAMTTRPVVAALRRLARSAGVVEPPISWYVDHGPWFGNGVMTVVVDGEEATVEVDHAAVRGTRQCLVRTLTLSLTAPPRG
ncbi:MAG: alkaline phosphatase D family protein [Jatrophihabitans sp.]|uniref:alkaline phosphatase D family protein n=1 Tax=Jatrophihabitans sp. TaxID=1932789 RepID=UPI003F7CF5F8